ncbi:MAG: SusD/RagB family nutrient-binding outer membrane lipoprotein [Flavobacteriaceae bacterium]|nr:SusD/RagB family nutrient-binding outer membrane lipoprotein [Flavobacteriaceae bacterium]
MKNIFKTTMLIAFISFFTSCETGNLDLLENPNSINAESADPNFVLNDIQLTFNTIIANYSTTSQRLVRQLYQFGTYNRAVSETTSNNPWRNSYGMFANIDLLQDINDLDENGFPNHLAVAQILEAYGYMLLVDYIGDVPFIEANQPEEFPTPNITPGAMVYDAQLELLDVAIANLNIGSNNLPQTDLYFGDFDAANWIALANSLKIRAYTNLRLTDPSRALAGINAAINQNYIDNIEEDFQFLYSTNGVPIDSRHPAFTSNYLASGAGQYMSNNFYDLLNAGDDQEPFVETGSPDPRLRYYTYRQTSSAPSGSNLPCSGNPDYDYCYVGNLYWGRDHTDGEGIPNDGVRRTTYGVYPIGGAFDREAFDQARAVDESMEGAGIRPILLSSSIIFSLAETSLTLGTNGGSPVSLLESGIRLSMNKVKNFTTVSTVNEDSNVDYAMTQADIDDYVSTVISEYNSATNQDDRLAIIVREAYLASWGDGIEAYNAYRRTGFPDLQAPIVPSGPFPRNWRYPIDETDTNPNISQQLTTVRVFWDNNPPEFID